MTTHLRPKYISFDCYGTLINFQMKEKMEELFADRVSPEDMPQFTTDLPPTSRRRWTSFSGATP